jgi:hypothetical protein
MKRAWKDSQYLYYVYSHAVINEAGAGRIVKKRRPRKKESYAANNRLNGFLLSPMK